MDRDAQPLLSSGRDAQPFLSSGVRGDGRRWKTALLSTAAFVWAAHGFLFANECFSHDAVSWFAYSQWGLDFYAGVGRFLIPLCEACKGYVAAPWLIGILFTLWMALAGVAVTDLLGLQSVPARVLACALLCTNLSLTLTGAAYVYCLDEYALALLLSAWAAWLFCGAGRRTLAGVQPLAGSLAGIPSLAASLAGVPLLAASLAIYQPYFTVSASLCLLYCLRLALEGRPLRETIGTGIRALALHAAGFGGYLLAWRAVLAWTGVSVRREASPLAEGAAGILRNLGEANRQYGVFLFRTRGVLGWFLPAVHLLLLLTLAAALLRLLLRPGLPVGNRLLAAALLCLTPTAFHAVYVLIPGEAHPLTAYAREFLYLLAVLAAECSGGSDPDVSGSPSSAPVSRSPRSGPWPRRIRTATALLLCLVLWHHTVFANQAYMKKDLEKNATLLLAGQMIGRIEAVPGYLPGQTAVAFAGRLDHNSVLNGPRQEFGGLSDWVGLWNRFSATYNLGRYLTEYLGYPLLWDQEADAASWPEVEAMPVYPAAGSVALVRGVVVVKLS